ncbi:hypothetical protein ACQPW3_15145 [Actinosynnema sp. CA-248983]
MRLGQRQVDARLEQQRPPVVQGQVVDPCEDLVRPVDAVEHQRAVPRDLGERGKDHVTPPVELRPATRAL